MQTKLLLVGGSHADIPVIQAAKKLGLWVITTGNNPKDLGHSYADEYYSEDYSDPHKIYLLAKKLKIDAICASSNDFSAIACAYTAEKLDLKGHDGFDTALIIHHKDRFRKFALAEGLSVPKTVAYNQESMDSLNYPFIVKPIDLSGGKGIKKVLNKRELDEAITRAKTLSKSDRVVVEEFIEGSNHGYSTFIRDKKVVFAFMDDEHYFHNPYLVSGASTSLYYTKEVANRLNRDLEKMASRLNLVDGLLHVQFILKNNQPYVIEICRRTPGDLYVKLVEYATGFNMSHAIVQSILNQPISYAIENISYITRHCVMTNKSGKINTVSYGGFKDKIFDKMVFYTKGEIISNPLNYKAEIDFIRYNSREDMISNRDKITHNIQIVLL
jgi:biotin carboxylase